MSRWVPLAAAAALLVGIFAVPTEASAREEPPAAVAYGFDGFWTGAQIGLASGYLATGRQYEDHEWRKLVWAPAWCSGCSKGRSLPRSPSSCRPAGRAGGSR